ncbi:hypothetical protein J7E50_12745 [Pedobacter sp. ISL-68]|uniref:hypothetical protein n=1 Tax=unclassified Pedobacter TaxID=2628915 RepID=UPI001BE5F1D7|nr:MULTISPECIES: hypothetical protein [unclassified Pedobacter]MBT2561705.1 hypothetical protein [Pedobacter sp. ISL-64]MBT2591093.1 hypothetical protein [Pedobacter sp. ISL-68]
MRRQQAVYLAILILISGGCCFDLLCKCLPGLNDPSLIIDVPCNAPEFWVIAVGLLMCCIICIEILAIYYFIEEAVRGIDRFGMGPFQYAFITYGLHIIVVLLIGLKNAALKPFLIMEILGTGISWPYHLLFNILMFGIAYLGWGLRVDLAWEKLCDAVCGSKNYQPLFKRKEQN